MPLIIYPLKSNEWTSCDKFPAKSICWAEWKKHRSDVFLSPTLFKCTLTNPASQAPVLSSPSHLLPSSSSFSAWQTPQSFQNIIQCSLPWKPLNHPFSPLQRTLFNKSTLFQGLRMAPLGKLLVQVQAYDVLGGKHLPTLFQLLLFSLDQECPPKASVFGFGRGRRGWIMGMIGLKWSPK